MHVPGHPEVTGVRVLSKGLGGHKERHYGLWMSCTLNSFSSWETELHCFPAGRNRSFFILGEQLQTACVLAPHKIRD